MSKIVQVKAIQIFDSRGTPTISCKVILDNGMEGIAMVPSGASTGSKEALELRDREIKYHGKGVLKAVDNINDILGPLVVGNDPIQQEKIDQSLIDRDGTNDKSQLGANSILAISIAVSRVAASLKGISLHEHFSDLYKDMTGEKPQQSLPMPMLNILNGGEHADNNIDIQEFMIIPSGAESFTQAMQWSSEVYINLKEILHSMKLSTSVGDEGGFAPNLNSNEDAIKLIEESIIKSDLKPGIDINIALDCAASEFFKNGKYILSGEDKELSSDEFSDYLKNLISKYPITSIEDGMDENDIDGWKLLTKKIGNKCQLVGDDLFVTNKEILSKGIKEEIANAILIKFNQVGSLTETIRAIECATSAAYKSIISHRSGETEDTTIADLAVGLGIGQIKTGAPCRSDRVSKYNRLLWIEEENNKILLK
jgi:enolase